MTIATIPDDATEDLPPEGGGAVIPAPDDPEAKHRREMDSDKHKFAYWLIGSSVGVAVALSVAEFVIEATGGTASMSGIIDLLKLIATTALGFVFGQKLGRGDA